MSAFPWINNYPKGVPAELGELDYDNLLELFEAAFKNYAGTVAYENMGKQLTYADVDRLSQDFAAFLQHHWQLKKGDAIAIQLPNLLQYPVVLIGALRAGLVVVNTNPLYTPREMKHQYRDSGVKAVVILANFASNLEKIRKETDVNKIIVTQLGDMLGTFKGWLVNTVVKHVKKMVPPFRLEGALNLREALAIGAKATYQRPSIEPGDNAFLQYTGGTTGISKGAQLSHRNIVAHTKQTTYWFKPLLDQSKDHTMITAIPLYHIFALTVNGILMLSVGATNILITNPRDMAGFIKELKKHKFTLMTGVNTLFNGLMNQESFKEVDFSKLFGTIGGGMALQDDVARRWEDLTGKPLVEGYGLSETSPVLSCNPLDGTHKTGTIGLPTPGTEMAIFDEQGNQLGTGEVGEICARGLQIMDGYWNKDNSEVFFSGEWFRTGDMGLMTEEGFFKIVDRKKDMINVSGFNVYPNEIENVVANHHKVLEVAAIGVPDKKSTECVKIFVVKSDTTLTEDELRKYCKENLTAYKNPRQIEFRAELPKSNVGKIIRRELRDETVKKVSA
ncbi:MAG: AMP-binding protein [Bacteroidota bacterium]